MPEATVPAEGVKVGVSAGADGRRRVSVCAGTACVFAGSMKIHEAFAAEIAAAGLQDQVEVSIIGCHGLCSQGPLAVVSDGDTYYPRLKLKDVKTVVEEHLAGGQVVEKLLYVDPATGERIACAHDIPFYKAQDRIALRDVGRHQPGEPRRVPRPRRLRGRAQGAHDDDAGADPSRRSSPRGCAAAAAPGSRRA